MNEVFEISGLWWLPDKPDSKIGGVLKFNPEKETRLELIGTFNNLKEDLNKLVLIDIINGISSDGEEITLHRCFEVNLHFSSGFPISFYNCGTIFVGAHFKNISNIKFNTIYINYSNLDQWVNIDGFDISQQPSGESIIKYKRPETIRTIINDELDILISFSLKGPNLNCVQRETRIEQTTHIGIKFSEEKHINEFRKFIFIIQNFLSLAVGSSVNPLSISGYKSGNQQVKIFYRLINATDKISILNPHEMLFTFKDISTRFEYIIKNWIDKAELLKPVSNLYFGTKYNSRMYLEHQFLSIMQALESYHGRIMNNNETPAPEFEEKKRKIIDSAPCEYKNWLSYKLEHSNQPHLRKRLEDICIMFESTVNEFILDRTNFINDAANTRNYLTHYDSRLKDKSARNEELYNIIKKLQLLAELCLLKEIGFSLKELNEIYSKYEIKRKYLSNKELNLGTN